MLRLILQDYAAFCSNDYLWFGKCILRLIQALHDYALRSIGVGGALAAFGVWPPDASPANLKTPSQTGLVTSE